MDIDDSDDDSEEEDEVEVVARDTSTDTETDEPAESTDGKSCNMDGEWRAHYIVDLALITAEAMTLAQSLVNRKKTRSSLIDDGFNRRAFNDDPNLPRWFVEDEQRHNKVTLPVTKEAVRAIREKLKLLNARPIKKIAEAKARKKMRALKQAAKLAKKANNIADNDDMTEAEKASTIAKLAKQAAKRPKNKVQLVVARGANRGLRGRPKGVKGRYKVGTNAVMVHSLTYTALDGGSTYEKGASCAKAA
jgi:AdoMet-dependent rRNA methyltransferase SPB1